MNVKFAGSLNAGLVCDPACLRDGPSLSDAVGGHVECDGPSVGPVDVVCQGGHFLFEFFFRPVEVERDEIAVDVPVGFHNMNPLDGMLSF